MDCKLIELKVIDFKGVELAELNFTDGLNKIKGDNSQGKTSLLESIMLLFGGKSAVKGNLVNNSAKKATVIAKIELDGEEFTITRNITDKSHRLEFVSDKKGDMKSAEFLKSLVNELSFNPFPFIDRKPQDKVKFLMNLAGINFSKEDKLIAEKSQERVFVGREIKSFGVINYDEALSSELIDIEVLKEKKEQIYSENKKTKAEYEKLKESHFEDITKFNDEQERKSTNFNKANEKLQGYKTKVDVLNQSKTGILRQIEALKNQIVEIDNQVNEISSAIELGENHIDKMENAMEKKSYDFDLPYPELIDVSKIDDSIHEAMDQNHKIILNIDSKSRFDDKKLKETSYRSLTSEIEELNSAKSEKLLKCNFGIKGLVVLDDDVTFNGIPSTNWSDSEAVTISSRVWLHAKPGLKAVCVDRGEIFGKKRLDLLKRWAEAEGIQVIMTIVSEYPDSKKEMEPNTFYIQEGKSWVPPEEEKEEATPASLFD